MRSKKFIITFFVSYIFWILLGVQERLLKISSYELIFGLVVSLIVSFVCVVLDSDIKEKKDFKLDRIIAFIVYIPVFFIELLKANINMAKLSLKRNLNNNPGVVKIETSLKEEKSLMLLANSITLTPGTISVDIERDNEKNVLYIHWIDIENVDSKKYGDIIKGKFEPYIRRMLEK